MCKKCCKLKDLKQHYNEKMAEEGNSWFGRMCFRFEYFSGSFAFLSAVVTTLAILYQYIVIQRMTLTDANPYPMWLEGTCTCNGTLCPGVVFTMNFTTPQFCEGSGAGLCKGLLGESQEQREDAKMYPELVFDPDCSYDGENCFTFYHSWKITNSELKRKRITGKSDQKNLYEYCNYQICTEGGQADSRDCCARPGEGGCSGSEMVATFRNDRCDLKSAVTTCCKRNITSSDSNNDSSIVTNNNRTVFYNSTYKRIPRFFGTGGVRCKAEQKQGNTITNDNAEVMPDDRQLANDLLEQDGIPTVPHGSVRCGGTATLDKYRLLMWPAEKETGEGARKSLSDDGCFRKQIVCPDDIKQNATSTCEELNGFGSNTTVQADITIVGFLVFVVIISTIVTLQDFIANFIPKGHNMKYWDLKELMCMPCCAQLLKNDKLHRLLKNNTHVSELGAEFAYYATVSLVFNSAVTSMIQPGAPLGTFTGKGVEGDKEAFVNFDYQGAGMWYPSMTNFSFVLDVIFGIGCAWIVWMPSFFVVIRHANSKKSWGKMNKFGWLFVAGYIVFISILFVVSVMAAFSAMSYNFDFSMVIFAVDFDWSKFRINVPATVGFPAMCAYLMGLFRTLKTIAKCSKSCNALGRYGKSAKVINMEHKGEQAAQEVLVGMAKDKIVDQVQEKAIEMVKEKTTSSAKVVPKEQANEITKKQAMLMARQFTQFMVTIPHGVVGGQQIQLNIPGRGLALITVPQGMSPGQQFQVQC
jgi:hypothetical protein